MIIDFIGRNIRIVCLVLFIGLAATAASMYWNIPARWTPTGQKPAVATGASCPMHPAEISPGQTEHHKCDVTQRNTAAAAEHSGCGSAAGGCCGAPK